MTTIITPGRTKYSTIKSPCFKTRVKKREYLIQAFRKLPLNDFFLNKNSPAEANFQSVKVFWSFVSF